MIAIIHHGGCPDGTAAAWAIWSRLRAVSPDIEVQLIPASYDMPLPEWGDPGPDGEVYGPDEVYVVDFSWPVEDMIKLSQRCGWLCHLDHHQTAIDDMAAHADEVAAKAIPYYRQLDPTKSGAVLAWEFAHVGEPVPPLLQYVQDRDLWRWELPRSRQVGSLILTLSPNVEDWDHYAGLSLGDLLTQADGAYDFEQAAVRSALKGARWCTMVAPDGEIREFPIFPSPYILGSTGCEQLMEIAGSDMAGYFIDRNDGQVQFGFRSRNGVTVHDWAKKFGGGGHPQASGCTLPTYAPVHDVRPVEGV